MTDARIASNAEIADHLSSLAQLLTVEKANPYKIRAYRRAADVVRGLGDSVAEMVRNGQDLTVYSGIGSAIAGAIGEIVLSGTLGSLEKLRQRVPAELAEMNAFPKLDPKRVMRVYKKLGINSIEQLRQALETGEVERASGVRIAQHVRQGLIGSKSILLYHAHPLASAIQEFLVKRCGADEAVVVGDYRRRIEVIDDLDIVLVCGDFEQVTSCFERFGGRTPLVERSSNEAVFETAAGPLLRLHAAERKNLGTALIRQTGSKKHLRKLHAVTGSLVKLTKSNTFETEESFYKHFGFEFIPPELREGFDEVEQAQSGELPVLVELKDIRGDLHVHTEASDGVDSLQEMAGAAEELGYEYVGITDHSQSLKIANGLTVEQVKAQIRAIDKLNGRMKRIRILKSAEVDILADGSLDYPDEVLRELDYTVCSIHSRFAMNKQQQTERILRAMDNRYFTILGHATGRLLLKRPGYEIDMERVVEHARQNKCYFELNSSPDRLDLRAEHARLAKAAGVLIAISTDSHSTGEFGTIRYGLEQARRAGLQKKDVLNCQNLKTFLKSIER